MFIEPDPRRTKTPSSGGFFSSQRPVPSPRDRQRLSRKPATSDLQNKAVRQEPTVRLVQPSISLAPGPTEIDDSSDDRNVEAVGSGTEQDDRTATNARLPKSVAVTRTSDSDPVFSASNRSFLVSEAPAPADPANEARSTDQNQELAPDTTLLPDSAQQTLSSSEWHRRSTSSGGHSLCSTLQASEIDLARKSARSQRSSQVTTLRGTPTPYEFENQARAVEAEAEAEHVDDIAGAGPAHALETLQEASPELMTIRPIEESDSSTASSPLGPGPASRGAHSRSHSAPADSPVDSNSPISTPRTIRRALSTASTRSVPSSPNFRQVPSSSPVVRRFDSDSDGAISEADEAQPASPNFIAYSPDSTTAQRPISRTDQLRDEASIESISSRLYRYSSATAQPESGPRLRHQASWDSDESDDTLPPLYIPRRRVRHKPASSSLASQASTSRANETMDDEDIDTQPFPRRPFSNHLSTIASESDSRSASQHLSHWSLGSGVLTLASAGDASTAALAPAQEIMRRRGSAPPDSVASSLLPPTTRGSNEEAGDMTLGVYREESAIPQPLFRAQTGPSIVHTGPSNGKGTKKYDGVMPPLPPMPDVCESDEHYDTLSEMTRPSLHQKRSGYSLRARSNTTPGHSRQQSEISYAESDRFSQGTSIFPTWAKRFYSGEAILASKISLGSLTQPEQDRQQRAAATHRRRDSSWTDRSITSRLGHTYSNAESVSPTSSHFLPAIFRPRTRKKSGEQNRSNKLHKSRKSGASRSRPSNDTGRDSMAIISEPLPTQAVDDGASERLPSGHPRYGELQAPDGPLRSGPRRKPLRRYSKQGQWDEMEFPRPMTKDRLSDFSFQQHPHLAPTKRTSQNRLSFWQAPSFTESLSSLIHSRCNRQILLFALGFLIPLLWMLGAVLPLPPQPPTDSDLEKAINGSEDDVQTAMMRHEAGDAERRWREERLFLKAKWWRMLNRIMSFIGLLVIGAVVALVIIATR